MLKKFWQDLQKYKYRATIFALLGMATIFCLVLVRFRIEYSASYRYIFLIWNLFLAWVPFGISYYVHYDACAQVGVCHHSHYRISLADLLPKRAIYPYRPSTLIERKRGRACLV